MDAPVETLSPMTLDLKIAIPIAFVIGMFLSVSSSLADAIGSSIPNAPDPGYGSAEAGRIGFDGERVLFGGGTLH